MFRFCRGGDDSSPGSFLKGSLVITRAIIDNITVLIVITDVQGSPCHVPRIDKHTFPSIYKLGFNLVFPSLEQNLTTGGSSDNHPKNGCEIKIDRIRRVPLDHES